MPNIGFLGFGNMAYAIANGIINKEFEETFIYAYDPSTVFIDKTNGKVIKCDNPLQLVKKCKYIFLCVKPQVLQEALLPVVKEFTQEHVVVSILAGVTVESIQKIIEYKCPVVRTMPNTPLLLASGATAIARPYEINDADYEYILSIFRCVGSVFEIPSDKFNEIIPVNGSSPAFIYLFAKTIAEIAVEKGICKEVALTMIADTLIGSARMMKESDKTVDELIGMVSSKGGTTIAALEAMTKSGFVSSIRDGMDACIKRAYELGK